MKRFKDIEKGDTIYYVRRDENGQKMRLDSCNVVSVRPSYGTMRISGIPEGRNLIVSVESHGKAMVFVVDSEASQNAHICTEIPLAIDVAEGLTSMRINAYKAQIAELKEKIRSEKRLMADIRDIITDAVKYTFQ